MNTAQLKASQVSDAFEIMKEKIISYEWIPGSHLSSNQIASELGMSRTPIEKALMILEQYGLVSMEKGKFIVSTFDLTDLIELYQVKEALETEAVKIIIEKGGLTKAQVSHMKKIVESHSQAASTEDDRAYFREGMSFHRSILELSGNRRLCIMHDLIRYQNERAQLLNVLLPQQKESVGEHMELIAALEAGDLEHALRATSEHSRKSIARFQKILGSSTFRSAVLGVSSLYQK